MSQQTAQTMQAWSNPVTKRIKKRVDTLADAGIGETPLIKDHLERVASEMADADVSHLSSNQRAARAINIENLRDYAAQAQFPQNRDFPGERVPYFVDAAGTRCAMAHLIENAGGAELVEHVAENCNNAYVAELASEPALHAWLHDTGMTLEEAALVQPTYGPPKIVRTDKLTQQHAEIIKALQAKNLEGNLDTDTGVDRIPALAGIVSRFLNEQGTDMSEKQVEAHLYALKAAPAYRDSVLRLAAPNPIYGGFGGFRNE